MSTSIRWPFTAMVGAFEIASAEGAYLIAGDGRRILDAAGGAIVANVGHGRASVAAAVAHATAHESYVIPPWLTPSRRRLLSRLKRDWLPQAFEFVHLASGGSEGVETAMKLAIQHFAARGQPQRSKIIGRDISYHGTTLATLAVGGHAARKHGLAHALERFPVAPAPYALRSNLTPASPHLGAHYVQALRDIIAREGADTIAAFLAEPITGSSGGAIVPPDDYWPGVRALCDEYGILLIMDEVMTGFGRTGTVFGYQHWPIQVDILVSGKGLAGGYAPLCGIFATAAVGQPIVDAGMYVMFNTFGAHPAACAAADEVLRIMTDEGLVARAAHMGELLGKRLRDTFSNHRNVAEVRGRGLLQAIEIVKDRGSLECFARSEAITDRIMGAALERGVFYYPGGTGEIRDIICLGPAFIVDEAEIETMVEVLHDSLSAVIP
ncbi:MAG: aspartate aminotransferase family protein [Gammaproteobacteria bacterium]|nr:aspartate aminotransferase family protein [Gammaproteobacteria bacterium]